MKRILIFCLLASFISSALAASYYVRADGEVLAANKANATSAAAAATSLNMAQFNAATFAAGDIVYFSALGGDYTSQATIPSSGSALADVQYIGLLDGAGGSKPLIDVSGNAANANGILISGLNYITVLNIQAKGSGGAAVFSIAGSSGTLGSGYTVKLRNLDALSNYGASDAGNNHDCFSGGSTLGEDAQFEIWDSTATKCREASAPFSGSHQSLTLHQLGKAKWHGGSMSDSNYWYVGTLSSQAVIDGSAVFSDAKIQGFAAGADATELYSLTVSAAAITISGGECLIGAASGANAAALNLIKDSTIHIIASKNCPAYATTTLQNNSITVEEGSNLTMSALAGSTLNLLNNTMVINSGSFTTSTTGGTINASRNTISGLATGVSNLFAWLATSGTGGGAIAYNIFNGITPSNSILKISSGAVNPPTVYNNLFYRATAGGQVFDNSAPAAGHTLTVKNNISYKYTYFIWGGTRLDSNYNDLLNSADGGGASESANSITSDPAFVSAGSNFHLLATSPLIGSGLNVSISTDIEGKPVHAVPTIGAYEYQPGKLGALLGILQ